MVETDSPDQNPFSFDSLNEPAHLVEVARAIAFHRKWGSESERNGQSQVGDEKELLMQSRENLERLFGHDYENQ